MNDLSINFKHQTLAPVSGGLATAELQEGLALTANTEFEARAMGQHHVHHQHRTGRAQIIKAANKKTAARGAQQSGTKGVDHEHDVHLHDAVADALDRLHHTNEAGMESYLSSKYDALERHTLLRHAIANSDGEDREILESALAKLEDQHGQAVKVGLGHSAAFQTALHVMDIQAAQSGKTHNPDVLRQLRAQYGAKGNDKVDAPLTALTLANSLLEKFGHDNFTQALAGLRSTMSSNLRAQGGELGPRMWLSMSDAASFNAVQSSFAIGRELRAKFAVAGIRPRANDAATGVALLGVAEKENSDVDTFAKKIVSGGAQTPLQKILTYKHLAHAVAMLPTTLWSSDKERLHLLDGLTQRTRDADAKLPTSQTSVHSLERHLRNAVAAKPASKEA